MLYKSLGVQWRLVCVLPNGLLKVRREGKTYGGGNATEHIGPDKNGVMRRKQPGGITWGAAFKPIEMKNDPKIIAARLAEIAKERGVSQKTISETSGIRETTISRILTGKFAANSAYLCRIADAVGVRIVFDCDSG